MGFNGFLPNQTDPTQQADQQAPANNAQNAGPVKAGLRGVLARMLGNFSYGAGQAMLHSAGEETDAEKATRLAGMAHLNAQTQLLQQQAQMTPVQPYGPNGPTIYMPAGAAGPLLKQILTNQGKTDATSIQKRFLTTPQGLYDTQTKDANGFPTLIPNSGAGIPITADIAQQYNIPPEYIGKNAKLTDLASMERGNSQQNGFVMGPNGPVTANKVTGQAKPVTVNGQAVGNPGIATVRAGAAARAANTPFQTYDSDGNLITTSAANAIATGAPAAQTEFAQQGPTAATRTAGQAAGGVRTHIPELKQEIDALAQRGDLGPVMGRINTYLNSGYGGNDPLVAQFVRNMQLMNSGTLRAHFGARGAQSIYDKFTQTLNTAQNPEAMKGALDSTDTWLKTYGDMGTFKAPKTNISRPTVPQAVQDKMPKSSGFDWNSAPVKH